MVNLRKGNYEMSADFQEHPIILFDGVCSFCNASVHYIISKDTKRIFKFAALSSAIGEEIKRKMQLPSDFSESIIVWDSTKQEGHLYQDAVHFIMKKLSLYLWLQKCYQLLPRSIQKRMYLLVAKYRYWILGKKEQCDLQMHRQHQDLFL